VSCIADTMVLVMFVDAGHASLLSALAGGSVFVAPSVIDPTETPLFVRQPIAEFTRGIYRAQQDLSLSLHATRVQRRTAFYQAVGSAWLPVTLSVAELRTTQYLASPTARKTARGIVPTLKARHVGAGEAESAAVAITRDWTLWIDDSAIVNLLAALYPGHPVERISDLVIRAAHEGLIGCQEAADLYNDVFRDRLGLWTNLRLFCENGRITVR